MPSQTTSQDQQICNIPPDADASSHQSSHEEWLQDKQRIRVLPGATDSAASFEFEDEDHTLGNALRYIIMKNPDVEFCGYSIPHPSEAKMNIRIQTYSQSNNYSLSCCSRDIVDILIVLDLGGTVYEALEKGFNDLANLCDVVTDEFTAARDAFPRRD
ncbi:MAG: RNA polymerase subunit AC19 [Candelina submexicana]|nr:MAG: RNA polymerase subunit AC19 [Candelina submexicana]